MRRRFLQTAAAGAAALALPGLGRAAMDRASARLPRLVLAGPFAAVSNPFYRIAESKALADVADQVEVRTWKSPDQLRALVLDPKSPAQVVAMPSNVAANLYNRGARLKLANISTWGVLFMVSRTPGLKTLADFKGQEILMPFRADMPDIIFQTLARKQGLDPAKDFQLRYVASPLDAMQMLITRRADHALLAEPAASVALRKTHSFPLSAVAPELYRSVDLQQEWGRVLQRPPRIPQAGVAVLGELLGRPDLVEHVQQAYAQALQWCEAEPEACGKLVAANVEMLTPEGVADSVRVDHAEYVPAAQARAELEYFYRLLLEQQPGLVGGKLPDDGFYLPA
jgi:NitT/TauT family transport system substrate-binding protein